MQLLCGQCGQTLQVDDNLAGGTFTCPHCGHNIPVPYFGGLSLDGLGTEPIATGAPSEAQIPPAPADDGGEGFAEMARQSMSKRVRVACGKCGKGISVGARFAGKKAKCPACGTRILIPFPDEDAEKELAALKNFDDADEFEQLDEIVEQDENETPVDLSAPAPAVPSEASEIPEMPRRKRRRPTAAKKHNPVLLLTVLFVVILLIGLGPRMCEKISEEPKPSATPAPDKNFPVSKFPQNVAPPVKTPAVTAEPPKLKVDSVSTGLFAVDGYCPAPPDQVYAKITVTVTAGGEKLPFTSDGPVLSDGGKKYSSLGAVTGKSVVPVLSVKQSYVIDPGAARTMTLLFAVPSATAHASLSVPPAVTTVDLPSPAKALPPGAIVGTYAEKPPRNLQPLLRNPVMAALQGTANQTLDVRQGKDSFDVSIPAAGVSGAAKATGPNVYQGQLNFQGQSLPCSLRLADEGKLLVLYLSEEPFHQMTYQKK
jgi:DNA-directed RNA polymerase subunit RPC12/RpoP